MTGQGGGQPLVLVSQYVCVWNKAAKATASVETNCCRRKSRWRERLGCQEGPEAEHGDVELEHGVQYGV
jgi:hypothetical protein